MSRIRIDVSHDRLTAQVTVAAGEPVGPEALAEALAEHQVTTGVDDALVRRVEAGLAAADFALPRTPIAHGTAPVRGEDGTFRPAFEVGIQPGKLRDDGTLDYLERDLVKTALPGEIVGYIVPPALGTPGVRVDGTEAPAPPGRAANFRLGPSVAVDGEGTVTAVSGGAILYVAGRSVDVVLKYEHKGDVDLKTGNLHTQGSVVISGSVTPGFRVDAAGDIEVSGIADGARLVAGGNVRVVGLARGGAGGALTAAGDVAARVAESVAIDAGGLVSLQDAVHAEISAERVTIARRIRGGHARGERSVVVGDAGSPAGGMTILEAGVPRRSADELRKALALAKAHRRAGGEDRKSGKGARERNATASSVVARKIEAARQRDSLLATAFIEVRGTLWPGAVLRIGEFQYQVDWEDRGLRVSVEAGSDRLRIERMAK